MWEETYLTMLAIFSVCSFGLKQNIAVYCLVCVYFSTKSEDLFQIQSDTNSSPKNCYVQVSEYCTEMVQKNQSTLVRNDNKILICYILEN